jgi:hypothetical protein
MFVPLAFCQSLGLAARGFRLTALAQILKFCRIRLTARRHNTTTVVYGESATLFVGCQKSARFYQAQELLQRVVFIAAGCSHTDQIYFRRQESVF